MRHERFVRIFGGEGPAALLLAAVFAISILGGSTAQRAHQGSSSLARELAENKAQAVAATLLAIPTQFNNGVVASADGLVAMYANGPALAQRAATDDFVRTANEHIVQDAKATLFEYSLATRHARYATAAQGGLLLLEITYAAEQTALDRNIGRSLLRSGGVAMVIIGLFIFGAVRVRSHIGSLAQMAAPERDTLFAQLLGREFAKRRRNLLVPTLALSGLMFALDLSNSADTLAAIGYILAVAVALLSKHTWHTMLIAVACLAAP
jgi:hypothetical protein